VTLQPFAPAAAGGNVTGAVTVTVTGADPTGTVDSTAAIAAAFTALGSSPGTIGLPAGTYKVRTATNTGWIVGKQQSFTSPGATLMDYGSAGPLIHQYDAGFNTSSISTTASLGGTVSGLTIDGTNATGTAIGFQHGDMSRPTATVNAQNYTSPNTIGILLDSVIGWTNWGIFTFNAANCQNGFLLRNTSGLNVVGGATLYAAIYHAPGQIAFATKGGAAFTACGGNISINSLAGTANTGVALSIAQDNLGGGLVECSLDINMECDAGAGNVGPVSIAAGTSFACYGNTGILRIYGNGSAAYQQSTGLASYQFSWSGIVDCNTAGDYLGKAGQIGVGLTVVGAILESPVSHVFTGSGEIFNGSGNLSAYTLASGAQSLVIANLIPGFAQRLILLVTQPATGGKGTLTFTGGITDLGGGQVLLSTANGATDIVEVFTPDGVHTYATTRAFGVSAVAGSASINVPSNSAGAAPVLTPAFVNGTAAQLADTTRDYMVYLQIGTAGTAFTLAIGPTSGVANTLMASATPLADSLLSFRLPAGWYVKWAGTTTTLTTQTAVGC
jgi:hypothetical protein